jgi:polyisoprenyl-phosphate glycosyltransferase
MKKISIVTPCFNEESGITECYEAVKSVFSNELPSYDYEHLFIDNCSSDNTVEILRGLAAKDKRIKVIVNSRNFGLSRSPYYGKLQASGDAVIPMVADLQTPPELIPAFIEKWNEGYQVVMGVRVGMKEGFFLKIVRNTYYSFLKRVSNIEQVDHFIGYGLFDRKIIEIMRAMNDQTPYFRGIIAEIGFDKAVIPYQQPLRKHGKSRHSLFDLIELAILGITSYSRAPLRIMTILGLFFSLSSVIIAFIYLVYKIFNWDTVPIGITPMLLAVLILGSFQILCIGLVGEYIGGIFERMKARPLVIEKERINF